MVTSLIITVTRKPLSGTIAQNCLDHGSGALNVDGSRIGKGNLVPGGGNGKASHGGRFGSGETSGERALVESHTKGRWPANLVLTHLPGCECIGVRKAQTQWGQATSRSTSRQGYAGGWKKENKNVGYTDADGKETIADWACVEGCPVKSLDNQSGTLKTGDHRPIQRANRGGFSGPMPEVSTFTKDGDSGGASRFYKQFKADKIMKLPDELIEYLRVMISPPPEVDPEVLIALDLDQINWSEFENEQLHGLIARGDIEPHKDELWRILKPGAHIMMIAPDEDPTNHLNACVLEDKGFEIRDAICVLLESGATHYVAKASTRERNAGVHIARTENVTTTVYRLVPNPGNVYPLLVELFENENIDPKIWLSEEDIPEGILEEYSEYFEQSEATVKKRIVEGNLHPTVKPKALMEQLLADIPKDALVLDPFMGSGTTGVACIKTGHNFIGIEKEKMSANIAEARMRHWSQENWWDDVEIESEVASSDEDLEDDGEPTLGDMFGF